MAETRVLVPLDGSELAEKALFMLPQLAFQPLHLRLIAVINGWGGMDPLAAKDQVVCDSDLATQYLQAVVERLVAEGNVAKLESAVRSGDPALTILDEAEDMKAELLLMSTHGRSGFQRLRMGSIADQVIRHAPCSTIVVGPHVEAFGKLRNLAVPLDGSDLAETALSQALLIARESGGSITLIRVVPVPAAGTDQANVRAADKLEEEAATYLRRVAGRLDHRIQVKTHLLIGSAADELPRFVSEHQFDLTVMTTHGRSGLARAALGSVTDRMIANCIAPLMVVPAPRV